MTTMFLLEDEKNIREVVEEYLKVSGYDVISTDNGDDAIDIITTQSFDLVILDILVNGTNGVDVLKTINKDIPVIMLSAIGDEATQVEAFNFHADDYIIKPFSPILLLKRIEALLRRSNNAITSKQKECLFVDKDGIAVYYEGDKLNLTVTEFLIFDLFYSNQNKVFTRENILNKVFDDDYFCNDRIVDAHIKNLRKKLPKNYIKTVIGYGYSFNKEVSDDIL